VTLDNYSVHKHTKVQALNEASERTLLFLPTYSPDLMSIENAFSKIKALPRKAQAATQETLSHAIKHACNAITQQDVLGWFKNCGYLGYYLGRSL